MPIGRGFRRGLRLSLHLHVPDGLNQSSKVDGLRQQIAGAQPDRIDRVTEFGTSADEDEFGDLRQAHPSQPLGQLQPIQFGHSDIGDHDGGDRALQQGFESLPAAAGADTRQARPLQACGQVAETRLVVIDDEDIEFLDGGGDRDRHSFAGSTRAGLAEA